MSLNDIWDAPISPIRATTPHFDTTSSQKRHRETLFLSDSDNEDEQPAPKRPTSSAPRPDVDALFADIDNDGPEEEDDLRYKPLAPALDLEALRKQAAAKHALTPHQILPSSSPPRDVGHGEDDEVDKDSKGKGKGEGKERKKVALLDETSLIGATGFPQLIQNIKDFKVKGKGHELSDLHRILQVYQFWSHRLYPKTPFKDTVERVEKLCHSKRMQVRLSVWRDEAKGLVKPGENDDDDVIDLTDPNIESTKNDDSSSSRAPSLPPSSSEAEDDDFDIDAVVREEEIRLAAFRAQHSVSPAPPAPKAKYKILPPEVADGMDIDEEVMWNDLEIFDDPISNPAPLPPKSNKPSLLADDQDEEMWDMVRELEREEYTASKQLPVSSVLSTPSAETANTSLGTNDEDFDDIYA
ncbi:replication fork protection component Swi3-domain-containing protein [Suillus clintonianus]|uniref:replication fork protection component Swi3-domain-containing protein n=1 Tax=Suillus clintonianus TaxID=1904413 RepID=UPI001B85F1FE|nr:replication fork protection component Swi3-domain-containing protein [Suillus clintonianus]KAG2157167.1 replication fork protection component Swi3-domain-containing protein [Suillus clintonianus]